MIETEKGKRIEQILATDVTREQLAEALWCAENSQRMWHGCAEENRNFRLKAMAENAKLRELVRIAIEYCVNGYCAEEDECPLYESRHSCKLYANATELGVEVSK